MATKDESSVDVDFAGWSYKKEGFYFVKRNIFFTQCLYGYIIESFRAKIFLD